MVVLWLEKLERHVDDDRAENRPGDAPHAAEDDNREDEDENVESEVAGRHRRLDGREDPAAEPRQRRTDDDRETLEPVDGNAHHLGRERILPERTPGAPGSRSIREVQTGCGEAEHDREEVVLLLNRGERVAEELEWVQVADPARAAREPHSGDLGV